MSTHTDADVIKGAKTLLGVYALVEEALAEAIDADEAWQALFDRFAAAELPESIQEMNRRWRRQMKAMQAKAAEEVAAIRSLMNERQST